MADMKEKAKEFLAGAAKPAVVEMLRGYLVKKVKSISPDDIIEAIEKDDFDLIGKLGKKDRKLFDTLAKRFSEYIDMLTVQNVFTWLAEDLPFYAGVIYGHPKGVQWLDRLLKEIRLYVKGPEITLVEV